MLPKGKQTLPATLPPPPKKKTTGKDLRKHSDDWDAPENSKWYPRQSHNPGLGGKSAVIIFSGARIRVATHNWSEC